MKDITFSMYVNICQGLFEKDKLTYAFVIAVRIMMQEQGALGQKEWKCLLVGAPPNAEAENAAPRPASLPSAVYDNDWRNSVRLSVWLPALKELTTSLVEHSKEWETYATCEEPQTAALPGGFGERLSDFQKLLVLSALRPAEDFIFQKQVLF